MPTLLDQLQSLYPTAKKTTLRQMLAAGRITVDGHAARSMKQEVAAAASIRVADRATAQRSRESEQESGVAIPVVYEDADLIVIDKPAGLLTSAAPRDPRPTVIGILRDRYANRAARIGLVHRLDRDASGLLVLAKSVDSLGKLKQQFADKSATRIYHAIVDAKVNIDQDTLESFLVEYADGTVHETRDRKRGERAITHYTVVGRSEKRLTLLRVKLETGRKHQIRVHLAGRGWPICGDELYHPRHAECPRLMLAATTLELTHPTTGKPLKLELQLPAGLRTFFGSPA